MKPKMDLPHQKNICQLYPKLIDIHQYFYVVVKPQFYPILHTLQSLHTPAQAGQSDWPP